MRQTSLALTLAGLATLSALAGIHACRAQDQAASQTTAKPTPTPAATPTAEDKALAAYYRQAIKTQEQEHTQEILALINDDSADARRWLGAPEAVAGDNKMIQALAGELPVSEANLATSRLALKRLKGYIESCRRVPVSQTLTIRKIPVSTTLDDLQAVGDKSPFAKTQMSIIFAKEKPVDTSPGFCEIAWSDAALYVRYQVTDASAVTKFTERDSNVYEDDCVELFFVSKSNPAQYWEINIGRNAAIRDVFIKKQTGKWFGEVSASATVKGLQHKVIPNIKDGQAAGYTVLAIVPWSDLLLDGAKPKPGDKFPYAVSLSDTFKKPDGSQGQIYYSNMYTFVGYHDVCRYDTLLLAE